MLCGPELAELTRHFRVVDGLEQAARETLLQHTTRVALPTGSVLFNAGSRCEAFLLPIRGRVRVFVPSVGGREIVLYRVGPGESCILTTSCLIGTATYPARGLVEEALEGFALAGSAFSRLVDESRAFRSFVFHLFAHRMQQLMSLLEEVAFHKLEQRLAAWLVRQPGPLCVTHQQIADELGSAREIVSRLLKNFERENWVQLKRNQIIVKNPGELRTLANPV